MSGKKSQIDRAIESLEEEILIRQMAIARLREQQKKPAPGRRPRAVEKPTDKVSA